MQSTKKRKIEKKAAPSELQAPVEGSNEREEPAEVETYGGDTETHAPKRKVGRPRRQAIDELNDVYDMETSEVENKKSIAAVNPEEASPVPKKRGRRPGKWDPLARMGFAGGSNIATVRSTRSGLRIDGEHVTGKANKSQGMTDNRNSLWETKVENLQNTVKPENGEVKFDTWWNEDDEGMIHTTSKVERSAWFWCGTLYGKCLPDLIPDLLRSYENWSPGCLSEDLMRDLCTIMKLDPFRPAQDDWKDKEMRRKFFTYLDWALEKMTCLRLNKLEGLHKKTRKEKTAFLRSLPDPSRIQDIVIPCGVEESEIWEILCRDTPEERVAEMEKWRTGKPLYYDFLVNGLTATIPKTGPSKKNMREEYFCQSDATSLINSWDRWVEQELQKTPSLQKSKDIHLLGVESDDSAFQWMRLYYREVNGSQRFLDLADHDTKRAGNLDEAGEMVPSTTSSDNYSVIGPTWIERIQEIGGGISPPDAMFGKGAVRMMAEKKVR